MSSYLLHSWGNSAKEEVSVEKKYLAIVIICFGWMVSFPTAIYLHQIMNPTFSFDGSNRLFNIVSVSFSGTSATAPNYINMTIQNTGVVPWTLTNTAQVNSLTGLAVKSIGNGAATNLNCTNGKQIGISITMTTGWVSGNQYSVVLLMTDGFEITYVCTTP